MYVKDQNHKHYKVKSQTQMRKYRKIDALNVTSLCNTTALKSDIAEIHTMYGKVAVVVCIRH